MTPPSRPPAPLDTTELDIANTLLNEANAMLHQHREDSGNDGTGDDLPVLTEVIFDLGEAPAPPNPGAPPRPKSTAPASSLPSPATQFTKPQDNPPPLRQPVPHTQTATLAPAATTARAPDTPSLKLQTGAIPPRAQSAAPQPITPPPRPQVGMPSAVRPPAASAVVRPSPGAQTAPAAQRPAPPPVRPASPAPTESKPSPQTGSEARLSPTQAQPQPQLQAMWTQSSLPSINLVEPPPKPQTTAPIPAPAPAPVPPPTADRATSSSEDSLVQARAITEELKLLNTFIIGEVEAWLREELPALVVREISKLNERLRNEAIAHLRATLLPRISERISAQIERIAPRN